MNKIQCMRVITNEDNRMSPMVYCLFDEIRTDHIIYEKAPTERSEKLKNNILCKTMNLEEHNLLGIDNDIAFWFFYSGSNHSGQYQNCTLNVREGNEVHRYFYPSLWTNNVQAINYWFKNVPVMDIFYTTNHSTFFLEDPNSFSRCGAVVSSVLPFMRIMGYCLAPVHDIDGYVNIQPIQKNQNMYPKNYKFGAKIVGPISC